MGEYNRDVTCLPRTLLKMSPTFWVSHGVMRVPSLSLVVGHFFPKHQCRSAARHRLPEPAPPEPGLPVCHGTSTAPGGRTAQRGQAGGGPLGSAVSHQSLPGKAAPAGRQHINDKGPPSDVSCNQEPGEAKTKYARSKGAGSDPV